ncbi:hypothetical protein ABT56_21515 [Photobacterium aquae]|uniref:Uncharacterized protein n=1 Tax=Photobacterium aquae TaxID=1195763 RepID=A0A0J1GRH9_9GAMM|nr:hypothetical protein [Photobacterium aquae]KLV02333.1 hypothetical protein ABT56_21515 [Photobacterium aquae]
MLTANELVGKVLLVGITAVNKNQQVIETGQVAGTVMAIDKNVIAILGGAKNDIYTIPADLASVHKAQSGEYYLHSTGEVIVDPDYFTIWTVTIDDKERMALYEKQGITLPTYH